jgi:hypothetical protein
MPDVTYKLIDEMDAIHGDVARRGRAELGVSSFGMQIMSLPPHWEGYPEHDHGAAATDPGQEEVYLPLEGDGTLLADGQEYALRPGVAIRVGPDQARRIMPGARGLRFVALGGIPGTFTAPGWTEIGAAPPAAR